MPIVSRGAAPFFYFKIQDSISGPESIFSISDLPGEK